MDVYVDSSFKLIGAPIGIALVAPLLLGGVEAGAPGPDDLCTGDPCVIPETVVVDDGSDLDFGDRDLIVSRDVEIIVDGWGEDIHFEARSIVFEPGSNVRAKTPVGNRFVYGRNHHQGRGDAVTTRAPSKGNQRLHKS